MLRFAAEPIIILHIMASKLVYIGNLGAGYDLETVITAVNRTSSLSLDIAGDGPKFAALKAMAGERVKFHGYLGAEALKELLARCEVGVIPMRDDSWVGLPYKLGDYLAAGLKVLTSLNGECEKILSRYSLGLTYRYGSPEDFLVKLAEIDALRPVSAKLPEELDAGKIYPAYVAHIIADLRDITISETMAIDK